MKNRWWDRTESDVLERLESVAASYEEVAVEVRTKVESITGRPIRPIIEK